MLSLHVPEGYPLTHRTQPFIYKLNIYKYWAPKVLLLIFSVDFNKAHILKTNGFILQTMRSNGPVADTEPAFSSQLCWKRNRRAHMTPVISRFLLHERRTFVSHSWTWWVYFQPALKRKIHRRKCVSDLMPSALSCKENGGRILSRFVGICVYTWVYMRVRLHVTAL